MAEEEETIEVETPRCVMCQKTGTLRVPKAGWEKYDFGRGLMIQDAFPDMTPDEREMILTGTHPDCWDAMTLPED